jgi:hypothetical protein
VTTTIATFFNARKHLTQEEEQNQLLLVTTTTQLLFFWWRIFAILRKIFYKNNRPKFSNRPKSSQLLIVM